MKYVYFVAYNGIEFNGSTITGSDEIIIKTPLCKISQIREIETKIIESLSKREIFDDLKIKITNYILLREENDSEKYMEPTPPFQG